MSKASNADAVEGSLPEADRPQCQTDHTLSLSRRRRGAGGAAAECSEAENPAIAEDAASLIAADADSGEQRKLLWGSQDRLHLYTGGAGYSLSVQGTATAAVAGMADKYTAAAMTASLAWGKEEGRGTSAGVAVKPHERGNTYCAGAHSSAAAAPRKWMELRATEKLQVAGAHWKTSAKFVVATPARDSVGTAGRTTAIAATNAARESSSTKATTAGAAAARISGTAPQQTAAIPTGSECPATAAAAGEGGWNQKLHPAVNAGILRASWSAMMPQVLCVCMQSCTRNTHYHEGENKEEGCTSTISVPFRPVNCRCCVDDVYYEKLGLLQYSTSHPPPKDVCRQQHALRQGYSQSCSKCLQRGNGQQASARLQKPSLHLLFLDLSRRCWFAVGALEPRKFAVYAVVFVLAFTCGSLYGNHSTCFTSCPIYTSCCLTSAVTKMGRRGCRFYSQTKSTTVEGAAAATAARRSAATTEKGEQFQRYAGGAPAGTIEGEAAVERPAAATYSAEGAACHGKEKGDTATTSAKRAAPPVLEGAEAAALTEEGRVRGADVLALAAKMQWNSLNVGRSTRTETPTLKACRNGGEVRQSGSLRGKSDGSADLISANRTSRAPQRRSDAINQHNSMPGFLSVAGIISRSSNISEPQDGNRGGYSSSSFGGENGSRGSGTRLDNRLTPSGFSERSNSRIASEDSRDVVEAFPSGRSTVTRSNQNYSNILIKHSWKGMSASINTIAVTESGGSCDKAATREEATLPLRSIAKQRQLGSHHSFLGSENYPSRSVAFKDKAWQQRIKEVLKQRRAGPEAATYHQVGLALEKQREDSCGKHENKGREAAKMGRPALEQLARGKQLIERLQETPTSVDDSVALLDNIRRLLFMSRKARLPHSYNSKWVKQQVELLHHQDVAQQRQQKLAQEQQRHLQKDHQPTPHLDVQPARLPGVRANGVEGVKLRRREEMVQRPSVDVALPLTSTVATHARAGALWILSPSSPSATAASSVSGSGAAIAPAFLGPPPAAAALVHARRLQVISPTLDQTPESGSEELPHIREEHPQGGPLPKDELYKKRFEARVKRRVPATSTGTPPPKGTAAAPEKTKESSAIKRSSSDKKRQNLPRVERGLAAHTPGLLDPHIFRKELCPFLRTGDAQLKSWFTLLVLYIAEWPAYAHTGNGGTHFIDQLRYYSENFRSPPRATAQGKKLFEDELACGTNEVFKEGLVALRDRIHNFGDLTRVLKHLAKTERDFADLLDYTQYSKLPARAALTGFPMLLRTAFEGMVFSFCKSVFLRKGFKGPPASCMKQRVPFRFGACRPHTGIVILRSEEAPRFRAVGDPSSLPYDGGSKGQLLEVLHGVGAYSALHRIVSSAVRQKVGVAVSRFEELATERGDVSSSKGVLLPHVFVMGYYGKTSRGTEVREGLFGSEVEVDALEEMMEDLPAGQVLLQISVVDEWMLRNPAYWTQVRRSETEFLTAYTAVQMLRAELSWDPSLGSLGAFTVAYTGVTDLYTRQITTAEQRRFDPDVHVLLIDDATRFVQTASEEGCRSKILNIVSENPLLLRGSPPDKRISIRGTAKVLPSGEIFRKGGFGMGLSHELQHTAEKLLPEGHVMIHVVVRGLHRRSPEINNLDFTASELVSRLLQRTEGYYDIPVVKMVTPDTSESLVPREGVPNCGHSVATWIFVLAACSICFFFTALIFLLIYHEKVKLPWWLHCFCSSSSPWSVEKEAPARPSLADSPGYYGKQRRKSRLRSAKQLQAQQTARTHLRGAASTAGGGASVAGEFQAEGKGESEDSEGAVRDINAEKDKATLEPSGAALTAAGREGGKARGWPPAPAKWVEERAVPPSRQLSSNSIVSEDVKEERKTPRHLNTPGSGAEDYGDEESDGLLYADARSPSRQLEALGSASTSASACGFMELYSSKSVMSSEWQLPFSVGSSSVVLLQHQERNQKSPRCCNFEHDVFEVPKSLEDKTTRGNGDGAHSFCARVPDSPFPYLTSRTYSYSELSASATLSQQHAAAPFTSVRASDCRKTRGAATSAPAKAVIPHHDASECDPWCEEISPCGEQLFQGTDDNALPRSPSGPEKDSCVDTCAGPVKRKPKNGPILIPRQLQQAERTGKSKNGEAYLAFLGGCHGEAFVSTKAAEGLGTMETCSDVIVDSCATLPNTGSQPSCKGGAGTYSPEWNTYMSYELAECSPLYS